MATSSSFCQIPNLFPCQYSCYIVCYIASYLYHFLLTVTLEIVLLNVSIEKSYSYQFSWISIMILKAVQWNLCITDTLKPFISILIIKVSWLFSLVYMLKHHLCRLCRCLYFQVSRLTCFDHCIPVEFNDCLNRDKGWSCCLGLHVSSNYFEVLQVSTAKWITYLSSNICRHCMSLILHKCNHPLIARPACIYLGCYIF